jgi:hypothetical protein
VTRSAVAAISADISRAETVTKLVMAGMSCAVTPEAGARPMPKSGKDADASGQTEL